MQDVEMMDAEQVHPLQTQFEEAEDMVAELTVNRSSSDAAIRVFQSIIAYGSTVFSIIGRCHG